MMELPGMMEKFYLAGSYMDTHKTHKYVKVD